MRVDFSATPLGRDDILVDLTNKSELKGRRELVIERTRSLLQYGD